MSPTPPPAPGSRRDFIKTAGLFGGAAAAGWPVGAWVQSPKPMSASHSLSTFVYGQHLVGAQKKFFEAEGLLTEKDRDALMIFAADTRCSYANIVVRKELFDRGVKSVEALADQKLVDRKAVIAATAIGSGTYVYGVYVLKNSKGADGRPVNDSVQGARSVDADLIPSARFR
jgi:hypothetical protein